MSAAAPGFLDSIGLGWLELVPAPTVDADTTTHDCELSWVRDGLSSLSYTISCTAEGEDIELSELHLAVMDASAWTSGAWERDRTQVYTYEEQWPMDEDVVRIEAGRTWTYDGNMAAGMADWLGGEPRAVLWTADVRHPERDPDDAERLCRKPGECRIALTSVEPPR
ncbi:MAG: hypothetical protein EP330_11095 [Deltaproteobacteria bacterium]|nr:MAG: hypothetical protein EP330_11095 [Deltaproteobacteria bacterium]